MKTKPIFAIFLALLLAFVSCCSVGENEYLIEEPHEDPTKWHDEISHRRWTEAMLFRLSAFNSYREKPVKQKEKILEFAILLCIDQFNSNYTDKLAYLNNLGIPGIPTSIEAINFYAGTDHRRWTHLGWNHDYGKDAKGHPDIRRNILRNSVEYVFHFDKSFPSAEQAEKTREAMCCLLYVTHILGDRFHTKNYYGAEMTLLLADDSKAETVISDLQDCLTVLFPKQRSTVRRLSRQLDEYENEIVRMRRHYPEKDDLRDIDIQYALKNQKPTKRYPSGFIQAGNLVYRRVPAFQLEWDMIP